MDSKEGEMELKRKNDEIELKEGESYVFAIKHG